MQYSPNIDEGRDHRGLISDSNRHTDAAEHQHADIDADADEYAGVADEHAHEHTRVVYEHADSNEHANTDEHA